MQKFIENLEEAEKINITIEHMMNIPLPIIKDKKMLINIIIELKKSLTKTINAILQYEYIHKRTTLSTNPKENFQSFIKKSASRYKVTSEEIEKIKELFILIQTHNESTMEFTRADKIVILAPNMEQKTISIDQAKQYLQLSKSLLKKAKDNMIRLQ
jgi:hypothetical protein